jgi:hypothetical protein
MVAIVDHCRALRGTDSTAPRRRLVSSQRSGGSGPCSRVSRSGLVNVKRRMNSSAHAREQIVEPGLLPACPLRDPRGGAGTVGVEEQHRLALAHIVVLDGHASGRDGLAGIRLGEAMRGNERRVFLPNRGPASGVGRVSPARAGRNPPPFGFRGLRWLRSLTRPTTREVSDAED